MCASDTMRDAAALWTARTRWFAKGRDLVVRTTGGRGRQAGLRYGDTLRVGAVQCTSAATGVTCRNLVTRHGFWMSRTAYRTW